MTHPLAHIAQQWIARALALGVVGPFAASRAHQLVAPDGAHQTTLLTGQSISDSVTTLALILGLIVVFGALVGRIIDRREGLLNIGFVLGWIAWTSGRLGEVYRISPEPGTLMRLSIESLLIGGGVLLALMLMTNPKKGSGLGHDDEISRFDLAYVLGSLRTKSGLVAVGAAAVSALVVAFLFGRTDLAGQSVGVGFIGGILGGVVGTLASGSVRGEDEKNEPTAFAPIVIGVLAAGVLGPMIGLVFPGAGKLEGLVLSGGIPGFLIVSPSAWAMGALIGVPVGHSWVEHSAAQASGAQAKPA
jgi:hypothetical protein